MSVPSGHRKEDEVSAEITLYYRHEKEPEKVWHTTDRQIVIGRPKNLR